MPSNPDAKKPRKKLKTTVGQNTHNSGNQFGHAKKPLVLEFWQLRCILTSSLASIVPQRRILELTTARVTYSAHLDTGEFAEKARQ